ncbi:uncharacterized protein LOC113332429 [Papaver somniferum]|uniref:uncharacterized protein LOC113332429 n=1 Tax=Papaver somniferum TaxID=3469 RepID=UPI000E70090A|nr:uncharacterized protein LOC113332429 [Papaver somniferum]
METLMPSDDVPTKVFEALNNLLVLAIRRRRWYEYHDLEKFLASNPLLFGILLSRSCPLQTQFYIWGLSRQTDDLLDVIFKTPYKFEEFLASNLQDEILKSARDRVNIYPLHDASKWGFIHIVKLILIYESGSSSVCLLRDMDGNTPLHCALKNNRAKAFKTLLEWYIIHGEFLNNNAGDWECGDTTLDLLVDSYVAIVMELLRKTESKVCFLREFWVGKKYFVVIKCKNKGSIGTSFTGKVTSKTTNRTIASISVDSRSIITLKVLIRSAMVRGILDVRNVAGNTVFDLLRQNDEEVIKTNVMGFVPYERYENVIWLLDAIQTGDYEAFCKLQVEDPKILEYVCELPFGGTPLHIAVKFGKLNDCIRDIIRKKPDFGATDDHKARFPLHIASAKGYLDIVKELLTQFGSVISICGTQQDNYMTGNFLGTPIEYAIERGRISVVNELLPVWWKCFGVAIREKVSSFVRSAVYSKQFEALKMLMERYIEDELLKSKEVDGNPMSALADGYIEIVLNHLLSPKVNYSLSILVKNRGDGKTTGAKLPLNLYFVVIKVLSNSRREDNNIIDELQISAYYPKYFREVEVQNKMVLQLSKDYENSVTFKLLLRSPLFYQLHYLTDDSVFDALLDNKDVVENEMGTLIPIWGNKISNACRSSSINVYDEAKKKLGEGTKNGDEGIVAEGNGAAKEYSQNVKADYINDSAEDDTEKPHDQEMLTDYRLDGYTVRNQDRISLWIRQKFASLEECRNAIKDAAILDKTEVIFTKSTSERVVAKCSKPIICKWIIRAKAESNSSIYVVTEIADEHTCTRLKGATNKLATAKWVSSHIIDHVRQDHNISTQQIRHIMKQSKFQIDITRKSAERAKEGALDTIHGSQETREFVKSQYQVDVTYEATRTTKKKDLEVMYVTNPKENTVGPKIVLKRRRKSSIASSSLSSNAHQSKSNLRFLEHIPGPMHEYIHSTQNVTEDGHCGYRVVAIQSGYEPMDAWKQVRRELLIEIVQNEELYVKMMGMNAVANMRKAFAHFADRATDPQYWLSLHDAGYVIANAYKAVVVSLSVNSGNLTFLPLLEPPPEGRPLRTITFGFVDGNHFISLTLKPDAPIPQVDRRWDTNVSKEAEVWKTPYLNRFEKFKQIMDDQGSKGHCPIIILES